MKNQSTKIENFLLKNIAKHPKDIVAIAANHFDVTRTTIHRHLNKLLAAKKIIKSGIKNGATYHLTTAQNKNLTFEIPNPRGEYNIWIDYFDKTFSALPENIYFIFEYGFTEMFNNALDHSGGHKIEASTKWSGNFIEIKLKDDGIGVFKKIQEAFKLNDIRESVLAISKGKVTTDPNNHTGEGIFFTSRGCDIFSLQSNGIFYVKNNLEDDWFLEKKEDKDAKGTTVTMVMRNDSKRNLIDIFKKFQDPESLAFDRTQILVSLCKFEEEHFVSRSQAKRLMSGLEKFNQITLDFQKINIVGQGFADEVFRVFQKKYPTIKIEYINANENVEFMIKRSLATKS